MPITVTMIEEKEFKTKVRGYDPVEVDEFLDAICDEMIEMQDTIQSLREQLKQQGGPSFAPIPAAPIAPPAPIAPLMPRADSGLPADVEAAQQLLAKTQRICDETIDDAKKRADEIIQEAQDRVPDPELTDLQAEREKLRQEIEGLKKDALSFKKKFQSLLRDQNDILETELGE